VNFVQRLLNRVAPETRRQDLSWDHMRLEPGVAPMTVNADIVLSASSVAARCVQIRSEMLASVPLFLFRRSANGGRDRADDLPLYGVLHDQFHDGMTAFEGRELLVRSLDLAGNAYGRLELDAAGQVTAIYPLLPHSVMIEQLSSDRLRYRVSPPSGGSYTLLADEILHIRGMSRDGVWGLSPLQIARANLGLMLSQNEAAIGLSQRGLRSSGFLETGQVLNPGDREKLTKIIQEYAGVGRAGSIMVLEGGMKYSPLSWSPEDAELLASRKLSNEDVARLFGIPPTAVGITDRGTYSNTEQEATALVRNALAPLATRVETALMRACLTPDARRELFIEHDLQGLLRGDTEARYSAYATGRQWGWLSANDVRRAENQPPIATGDVYMQPVNMAPAGTPPAPAA